MKTPDDVVNYCSTELSPAERRKCNSIAHNINKEAGYKTPTKAINDLSSTLNLIKSASSANLTEKNTGLFDGKLSKIKTMLFDGLDKDTMDSMNYKALQASFKFATGGKALTKNESRIIDSFMPTPENGLAATLKGLQYMAQTLQTKLKTIQNMGMNPYAGKIYLGKAEKSIQDTVTKTNSLIEFYTYNNANATKQKTFIKFMEDKNKEEELTLYPDNKPTKPQVSNNSSKTAGSNNQIDEVAAGMGL
jgi:hypothetical protein